MLKRISTLVVLLCTALGVSFALAGTANASPPGGWGPVIACESGGQNIPNGSGSSASGYFQILDSTWASHGGGQFSSRAMGTSFANQQIVAERVLADQGIGAWGPSASCRSGKGGGIRLAAVTHTGGKARAYHHHHRWHHHH